MQIKVLSPVLMGGRWHEPGTGNYDPDTARHLIEIGAAIEVEAKIDPPKQTKKKTEESLPASQQGPASMPKTVRRSGGRTSKRSQ